MAEYRTVNIKKKVFKQLEKEIEDKPYESVKDLMLSGARNELDNTDLVEKVKEKVLEELE